LRKRKVKGALTGAPFSFGEKALEKARSTKPTKRGVQPVVPESLSPSLPGSHAATDLAEVRRQIADLVRNGAVEMVETTIDQVGHGHYLGMKYLFEMIGLYPAPVTNGAPTEDSLAATLLRRLGLPETQGPEQTVTKYSGASATAGGDGLE
jgi:hypothetical protein